MNSCEERQYLQKFNQEKRAFAASMIPLVSKLPNFYLSALLMHPVLQIYFRDPHTREAFTYCRMIQPFLISTYKIEIRFVC